MNPEHLLTELDGPRPLPPALARRIEHALIDRSRDGRNSHAETDAALLRFLDAPRALSPRARAGIERALMRQVPSSQWSVRLPRAMLAAAAVLAVLAGTLIVTRAQEPASRARSPVAAGVPAPEIREGEGSERAADSGGRARAAGPQSGVPAGGGLPLPRTEAGPGAPPPFAYRGRAPDTNVLGAKGGTLRVAVAGGDAAQEAGFRGYVAVLNEAGGIHGRRMEPVGPTTADALVTVNLGAAAVATASGPPTWVHGPLLETLAATEEVLRGRVMSFASPPERQAHLLAAAVFPNDDPSGVAVVYRGSTGVFAERIPRALREVLESRRVRVVEMLYEPDQLVPLVPADAVFLSLDQASTLAFLDYARARGYLASGTVACIFPMLDNKVIGQLRDRYLVLSPYSLGYSDEAGALAQAAGRPVSSATIHGWVTAKSLAVALWQTGADTQSATADALRGLTGYHHGFAPPYEFRRWTNARVPEGILYEVRSGKFVGRTEFETDPF